MKHSEYLSPKFMLSLHNARTEAVMWTCTSKIFLGPLYIAETFLKPVMNYNVPTRIRLRLQPFDSNIFW